MTKAEEILENLPSVKIGLDDHYGKQTVLNALNQALSMSGVSGEVADFSRFLSEEYSIEIHDRIIDEWNKYYSANYR
jgi:hypothetical protein